LRLPRLKKKETNFELIDELAGFNVPEPLIRNQSPETKAGCGVFPQVLPLQWCHHLGMLLFSSVLQKIGKCSEKFGQNLRQFLAQLLVGAVNIEQSKLINTGDLRLLLGPGTYKNLLKQRQTLADAASPETILNCFRLNGELIGLTEQRDFYLDPHTKHYTGEKNVLKGWVGALGRVEKAIHSDFIHTSTGYPAYFETTDNYLDLRERIFAFLTRFHSSLKFPADAALSFVIDRGIFGADTFKKFVDNTHFHIITWEKNYKPGGWDEEQAGGGEFQLLRKRNNSTSFRTYNFSWQDTKWRKDGKMRRIIVRATNHKGRTIEVAVLTDDPERPCHEIIELIFNRWLQENDFKYLEKHFGINQITSYKSISYDRLRNELEDKQITSALYKSLQKDKQNHTGRLKGLLLKRETTNRKQKERKQEISDLEKQKKDIIESDAKADRNEIKKSISNLNSQLKRSVTNLGKWEKFHDLVI